jgi:glycosyltransferase involved in cell wall biosynthesis
VNDRTGKQKVRVGLYMFTPMIGGAEMYLKHLLWNLDRRRYDITLFLEPWPEFSDFLETSSCRGVRVCPVRVLEPGGHVESTNGRTGKEVERTAFRKTFNVLRSLHRRMPVPVLKMPGRAAIMVLKWLLLPLNLVRLYSAFRRRSLDVVHITNGGYPGSHTAQLAAIAARLAGCRWRLMTICNVPAPVSFPKMFERVLDALLRKSLGKIVVPSDAIGRAMVESRGFAASQLEKISFATMDPREIIGGPAPPVDARSSQSVCLGMVASFLSHKGHRYIIEAMPLITPEFPDVSLTLVGGGPTREDMESLAQRLGVAQFVRFLGFCSLRDTLGWMNRFDIVVHSSDMEGMPYVILYAMGLGKPAVASSVGGIPDLIEEGKTGFLTPPGDAQSLARAIRILLSDPELRTRMGSEARRRYESCFTLQRMIDLHERLYDSVPVS